MEKYAIGIDIGGTKILAAVVGQDGRIIGSSRISTDNASGSDKVIEDLIEVVTALTDKHATCPITCIGIGVAGQVEKYTGKVIYAPNLNWQNVNLRERIETHFAKPVAVCNDVRAAAWGEWLSGVGKGSGNLICVFVGTGIGGAIVCNGTMVDGYKNTAGEIGHIVAEMNGPTCTCGNRGCLEALAGGWAIQRDAQELARNEPGKGMKLLAITNGDISAITAKTVVAAALEGDAVACSLMDKVVDILTAAITSLVNTIGPDLIIMGGGIIEAMPDMVKRIEKGVKANALHAATSSVTISRAKLHNDAGAIGAALFALKCHSKH